MYNNREKAECFISFFSSVFSRHAHTLDKVPRTLCGVSMSKVEFSLHGIEAFLKKLDPRKASGPDDIPTALLKLGAHSLSKYLCLLFNKSIDEGCLPPDWKKAHIVPIHKSGPRNLVSNYRPVSLISKICKLMEHVLFSSIMKHLNENSLLNNCQHGFRSGLSCVTQLTELTHDLSSALDRGDTIDCIFLHFQKAFDVVHHDALIEKLSWYCIDSSVISWIKNYLQFRYLGVIINGEKSGEADVTSGVPQGSILGPLLFLIYVNDISDNIDSSVRMFADDCVLYRVIHDKSDCAILQGDIDRITQWCADWHMKLNVKKTVHMCFSKKKNSTISDYLQH